MGIEPTSAFDYTAGCGIASAARRLNRSAFGDSHRINPGVFPGGTTPLDIQFKSAGYLSVDVPV